MESGSMGDACVAASCSFSGVPLELLGAGEGECRAGGCIDVSAGSGARSEGSLIVEESDGKGRQRGEEDSTCGAREIRSTKRSG